MFARLRAFVSGIVLTCVVVSAASGATYTVRQDGTGDFTKLSDAVLYSYTGFERCAFVGNSTNVHCGALQVNSSTVDVYRCFFEDNQSMDVAGALEYYNSSGIVMNNTFYNNTSANRATVVLQQSAGVTFERNILAGETQGYALQFLTTTPSHSCNVFWQNVDGPISGGTLEPDEIVADPQFCSPMAGDFFLHSMSPAAASNSLCGALIGAYSVGCGTVPTESVTWGGLKSIYTTPDP